MAFHPSSQPSGLLRKRLMVCAAAMSLFVVACVTPSPGTGELHRWWAGLGPVLPHESFPSDCTLCHVGEGWNVLQETFKFDHERKTGVRLVGAHKHARCLRCHNDRGPVAVFKSRGCVGCHEDFHAGALSRACDTCHQEHTWEPVGMIEKHNRSRFPLTGGHLAVACHRCHPGSWVGNFIPTDTECVTCHINDALATTNPPHAGLGWVDNCQRCHMSTRWNQAVVR